MPEAQHLEWPAGEESMPSRLAACADCSERLFGFGDGKCGSCFGSGVNVRLNSPDHVCPSCAGTGVCSSCHGNGTLRTQGLDAFGDPYLSDRFWWTNPRLLFVFVP